MKYKLIKEYPGSPKLGTILTHEELQWCNWDEYYQEVVEKDYEILSLIEGKLIYPCDKYSKDYINQLFNTLGVSIHSVKRLSDGEIFTIGDKVFTEYVNYTINKIDIVNDKCMVSALYDTNNPNGSRLHYNLNNLKKFKQKLFTTEDGVDIFEGESYYELITPDFHNKPCIWNILPTKTRGNINYDQEGNRRNGRIWFSTKEKAEEYILMNKPVLSLNDLKQFFPDTYIPFKKGESATEDINTKQLEDLVKSKIQQSV